MAEKMVGNKFWMKIRDMAFDKDGKEGKPKICCHFNIEAQWSKINKIHPEIHQPFQGGEGFTNHTTYGWSY